MGDIKEKFSIKVNAGVVSVDEPENINASIEQQILNAVGAIKARGFSSAKLTLTFSASAES